MQATATDMHSQRLY